MEIRKRVLPSRQAKNLKINYKSLAGHDHDPDEQDVNSDSSFNSASGSDSETDSRKNKKKVQANNKNKTGFKQQKLKAAESDSNVEAVQQISNHKPSRPPPTGRGRGRPKRDNVSKKEKVNREIRSQVSKSKGIKENQVVNDVSDSSCSSNNGASDDDDGNDAWDYDSKSEGSGSSDSESENESGDDKLGEQNNDDDLNDFVDVVIKEEPEEEEEQSEDHHSHSHKNDDVPDFGKSINGVPFKIIKVEKDQTPEGNLSAVWVTSIFTIKAILPEPPKSQDISDPSVKPKRPQNPFFPRKKPKNPSDLPKILTCPVCNQDIPRHKLNDHLATKHKDVKKPFSCEFCPTKWKNFHALKKHLIRHSDNKPYNCDICGTRFKRDYSLKHHQHHCHTPEGHDDWDEYCKKVNAIRPRKGFVSTANIQKLKGYRIGHSGYRIEPGSLPPYKCPDCTDEFDTPYQLQRHHAFTHQERPFLCTLCGHTYTTQNQLNVHMAGHTNVRPFVCDQCGATYKNNSHLNLHFRRYHDPEGHEQYKAYRRMIQRKQRIKMNKIKEAEGKGKKKKKKTATSTSTTPVAAATGVH